MLSCALDKKVGINFYILKSRIHSYNIRHGDHGNALPNQTFVLRYSKVVFPDMSVMMCQKIQLLQISNINKNWQGIRGKTLLWPDFSIECPGFCPYIKDLTLFRARF